MRMYRATTSLNSTVFPYSRIHRSHITGFISLKPHSRSSSPHGYKVQNFSGPGRLTASISLDGVDFQSIGSFDLTATLSLYSPHTFSLNNTSLGNMSGKMGYIRFELTYPGTGLQVGMNRVYIDNVRLVGVGLPLQTESAGVTTSNAPIQIAQTGITSLIETARPQWQGASTGARWGRWGCVVARWNYCTRLHARSCSDWLAI